MRILYIVTAFPRSSGDVITPWLIETIKRLRGRGIEVEVLAPAYRGLRDQVIDGITVHRFRYAPAGLETLTHDQTTPDRLREKPAYLGLVPGYVMAGSLAAIRLAKSGRFDILHAFWPLPHGILGLAAQRIAGVPLVSTFFGVELTWLRKQLPFLAPVVRGIIRKSAAVTVISRYTAAEVERLVPEASVRTIPFGAAVQPVPQERAHSGTRQHTQLLFVGRLVERKGVHVLLRALAAVRESAEVRLTIIGDGPMMASWSQEARELGLGDAVSFRGFVSDEDLAGEYARSDIFVLPAVRDRKGDVEGLGVVLIEALMHGLPVIASDCGGIPDVVTAESGLLVPPGDVDALAQAIMRFVADPGLARRMAEAGAMHVDQRFSWGAITNELTQVYTEVLAGGRPRNSRRAVPGEAARPS